MRSEATGSRHEIVIVPDYNGGAKSGNPMRSVLVVYGTTEGQTRKIAEFIANALKARGVEVELVDSAGDSAALVQPICVAAIVCGSLHRQRYQASLEHFVRSNKDWLAGIPTAFVAVSLTAAGHDERSREELGMIVESFCRRAGWAPTMIRHAAGALRYSRYHWLKRMLMQRIAGKQGGDTDVSRDHEYTDWGDLTRFVAEFLAAAAK
jgi:menaquinone-dependent protoporphyrinogen oxidase